MSAKTIAQFADFKNTSAGVTANDCRHRAMLKLKQAQKLISEAMELEAKAAKLEAKG
jgi:hypothetical protein